MHCTDTTAEGVKATCVNHRLDTGVNGADQRGLDPCRARKTATRARMDEKGKVSPSPESTGSTCDVGACR